MTDPIGEMPEGYAVHRVADTWLVLDTAEANGLVRLRLADPEIRRALFARAPRRGRGHTPTIPVRPDLAMVLRRYRHGGLLAGLTRSLFIGPGRALDELRVTARAEASGAPVPRVLCLILWPVIGPFWSAVIGTREERHADDLLTRFQSEPGERERQRLAAATGTAVGRLHRAGVEHRDLQLRNLVVSGGDPGRIVVLDLDRAVFHLGGRMPVAKRAHNLGRLARSAVKAGLWGNEIGRREVAAFVHGYTAHDRELRAELRDRILRERAKLAVHRIGYWLSGRASSTSMTGMPSSTG